MSLKISQVELNNDLVLQDIDANVIDYIEVNPDKFKGRKFEPSK
jgi:hypothetical protein